ncbi:MAG: TolB family protein, partial [Vicinamibacterales bacterium]
GTRNVDAARFCDSARMDTPGRFSRDGAHVAFTSNRSGSRQVWVATRDCSAPRGVTAIEAASVNIGSWSPDGRAVAFDAVIDGNADVYVVGAEGGPIRRLTDKPSVDSDPEWSGDGRWIYYVSDASGRSEIWRIPAGGGQAAKVTSGGGFEPREASDGRTLYYVDRPRRMEGLGANVTLKQVPASGGEERVVLSGVRAGTWDITDRGIIFLTTDSDLPIPGREGDALAFYDFADRRVRPLAKLSFNLARFQAPRLTVSRDGRWVLANHLDAWERDVMVADNFR